MFIKETVKGMRDILPAEMEIREYLLGRYPEEDEVFQRKLKPHLPEGYEDDMKIICQPLDFYGQNIYTASHWSADENGVAPEEPQIIELEVNNHNFVKEFEVFGDAIVNGTDVPTPVEEGAKTVAACLAIVESANTGKIVKPDYNF